MNEKEFDKKWNPIYKERVESSHSSSSPETRERLAILETNQNNIMEKLIEFQVDNKEQHQAITVSLTKLENKLDEALEKKADKSELDRMRNLMLWFGGVIGTGIIGYIGLQIVKVIENL